MKILIQIMIFLMASSGCESKAPTQELKDQQVVQRQQSQYAIGQPVPAFDWSLERDMVIQLYKIRNRKVVTHSVWRSDFGQVEGDCPSIGYGLPYDTSLTNPQQALFRGRRYEEVGVTVSQAEPNGVFASKTTAATWIMCVGEAGTVEPHYVETKVTVYPGPVEVDYPNNRVIRAGTASVTMTVDEEIAPATMQGGQQ